MVDNFVFSLSIYKGLKLINLFLNKLVCHVIELSSVGMDSDHCDQLFYVLLSVFGSTKIPHFYLGSKIFLSKSELLSFESGSKLLLMI